MSLRFTMMHDKTHNNWCLLGLHTTDYKGLQKKILKCCPWNSTIKSN